MARTKKETQVMVRLAGLRTEKKFFGPRGIFAKAGHVQHLKNLPEKRKFYFIDFSIDGQSKQSDAFTTERQALAWMKSLQDSGIRVESPKIHFAYRAKRNPITVVGNPPARINTTIAGVLYNRCREIRAEKTSKTGLKGLYYHPFLERSKVMVLGLDNGDLLIHSQVGEKLWKID